MAYQRWDISVWGTGEIDASLVVVGFTWEIRGRGVDDVPVFGYYCLGGRRGASGGKRDYTWFLYGIHYRSVAAPGDRPSDSGGDLRAKFALGRLV